MTNLIERLCEAIFRQEGMGPTALNPGNLRGAVWLPRTVATIRNGFWVPRSRAEGVAGAAHVVALHIAEGNTLKQLISIWAPPSDHNNTEAYIANVKNWAAIPDENQPLYNFIEAPLT